MFRHDKAISNKMDCRKQYEQEKFDRVYITYGEPGIHIEAFLNEENNDRQELFIPERYIVCVGVDYQSESKQLE
jgi:hypothetical protein